MDQSARNEPRGTAAALIRDVQARMDHPAVVASGLRSVFVVLCEYLRATDARIAWLESTVTELRVPAGEKS